MPVCTIIITTAYYWHENRYIGKTGKSRNKPTFILTSDFFTKTQKQCSGEILLTFQQIVLWQLDIHLQNCVRVLCFVLCIKIIQNR